MKKIEDAFGSCISLESVTLPTGVSKISLFAFGNCDNIKTIYVPAKKADYYKQRLPLGSHDRIVELVPEKKAKKK